MTLDQREREEKKEIIKEAITEWLDKKFAEFGKWTIRGLIALGLAGVIYILGQTSGWKIW